MNRNTTPVFRLSDELEHTSGSTFFRSQNVTKTGLFLSFCHERNSVLHSVMVPRTVVFALNGKAPFMSEPR
jgi:hypothetical protein